MKKKYKAVIGILALLLVSLYFLVNPSNVDFFPKCPFHQLTGLHCPGCGSQRAIHDLSRLNLAEAFSHNAILIITLFFGIGLFLYSREKFSKLIYHPKSPWIIFSIISVFWILRNLNFHPFCYLAP